jgi:hypothetical protein
LSGVLVPPLSKGKVFSCDVFYTRQKEALWLDPKYNTESDYWSTRFREEREATLNHFNGKHPPPKKNMPDWIAF